MYNNYPQYAKTYPQYFGKVGPQPDPPTPQPTPDDPSDYVLEVIDENLKTAKITQYNGLNKDLYIPYEINGYTITQLYSGVFMNNPDIESVYMFDDKGLEVVGVQCFRGCTSLKTVHLPHGLTTLDQLCFYQTGIEEIVIPNTVTTTSDVSAHGPFAYGTGANDRNTTLKKIVFEDGAKVIPVNMCHCCYALEDVTIPDSVETISQKAFEHCENLKTLRLPSSLIYLMSRSLLHTGIEEIAIPKGVIATTTTNTQSPFGYGTGTSDRNITLKKIEFTEGMINIPRGICAYCYALEDVGLPSTVTTVETKAFSACQSLSSVHYNNTFTNSQLIDIKTNNDYLTQSTTWYMTDYTGPYTPV